MLLAVFGSYHGLLDPDNHVKWLSMVNLLAIFQFVLMFQFKTTRTYWQLILLSFGQVAAAAALSGGVNFGLLLLGYLLMGIVALSLLLIDRESAPLQREGVESPAAPPAGMLPPQPLALSLAPAGPSLPAASSLALSIAGAGATTPAAPAPPRWPLAGTPLQLAGSCAETPIVDLSRGLLSHALLLLGGSLTVAAVVFFLLPRSGANGTSP